MSWKGFLVESKLWMDYPTDEQVLSEFYFSDLVGGKTVNERKKEFWRSFLRAWVKFHWIWLFDSLHSLMCRLNMRWINNED